MNTGNKIRQGIGDRALGAIKSEWPNLILWSYLISPLFLILVINNQHSKIDLLAAYNIVISLLWLLAIRFSPFDQFKTHIYFLPIYLAALIDIFLIINFQSRLTTAYIFIGITNYQDASEFIPTYWRQIATVLTIFALIYATALTGLYRRPLHQSKRLFLLAISGLLLGYGSYLYKAATMHTENLLLDLVAKDQSTPTGYLSQIGLATRLYFESEELVSRRRKDKVKITSTSNESNIDTIVFVIGESSRPQNWSLFGYHKQTTPYLANETGILKFDNMCTTAPYTSVAVPSMLSLAPISDWETIASTKSLVGIYREAGYDTYWLSAQEVDSFGGIIPHIAAEAQYRQYFERSYDEALLPEFKAILEKKAGKKQAIFIHLKGSHFQYSRRYPKVFANFQPETSSEKDKIVAEYDNSILYTDWVLSRIIDQLKSKPSLLFYASDHGENLMDDDRNLLGHGIGNAYDLSTAAFVWASNKVSTAQSANIAKLKSRETQKISISSLSHTLLDISGVFTSGYNKAHDLLSDQFVSSSCSYKIGTKFVPGFEFDKNHQSMQKRM